MEEKGWHQVVGAEQGSLGLILNAGGSGDHCKQSLGVVWRRDCQGTAAVRPEGGAELEPRWK